MPKTTAHFRCAGEFTVDAIQAALFLDDSREPEVRPRETTPLFLKKAVPPETCQLRHDGSPSPRRRLSWWVG